MTSLDADTSISELTVAISHRPESDEHQELREHIDDEDDTNVVLELTNGSDGKYDIAYTVDSSGGRQRGDIFAGRYEAGNHRVVVGTYDGSG